MVKKKNVSKLKFENFKGKKVITVRDSNGKLVSRTPLKGSGIRTKDDAYAKYLQDGTLAKDSKRLRRFGDEAKLDKGKLIIDTKTGYKTVKIKDGNFAYMTGKNTVIVNSNKKLKGRKYYQVVAKITAKGKTVTGYSKIRGNKDEALTQAMGRASNQPSLWNYDWSIIYNDNEKTSGVAVNPRNNNQRINFKVDYHYNTYINATKKDFTPNKSFDSSIYKDNE